MKKLFTALFSFMISITISSGVNLNLEINHMLNDKVLTGSQVGMNNLSEQFNVTRLDYYISEISIVHDGGQVTSISDFWVFVNAFQETSVELGSFNIGVVEGIKFYIGVDETHNHADPSQYESSHPLAPRIPSMHWGWASGYRFAALEGNTGAELNTMFQLHALGDQNYFLTSLPASAIMENGNLTIKLNADYAQTIKDIYISGGIILHSDVEQSALMLLNFSQNVFTSAIATEVEEISINKNISNIYPNPTMDGRINLNLNDLNLSSSSEIIVSDISGKQIGRYSIDELEKSEYQLMIKDKGVYFIYVQNGNTTKFVNKFVVQ